MARIKGVDIPNDKRIEISLTYIYGIGRNLSKTILNNAKVDLNKKAKDLTDDELSRIRAEVEWICTSPAGIFFLVFLFLELYFPIFSS